MSRAFWELWLEFHLRQEHAYLSQQGFDRGTGAFLATRASAIVLNYSNRNLKDLQSVLEKYISVFFETTLSIKSVSEHIVKPISLLIPSNDMKVSLQRKHNQLLRAQDPYFASPPTNVQIRFDFKGTEEYYKTLMSLPIISKNLRSQMSTDTVTAVIQFSLVQLLTDDLLPVTKGVFANSFREFAFVPELHNPLHNPEEAC